MQNMDAFTLKAAFAAVVLFLVNLFGGASVFLSALLILILIDILTGFLAAAVKKQLQASVMFAGGCKKMIILAIIVLVHYIGDALGLPWLREAVISYYAINEALSIMENAIRAGVPVPAFLTALLKKAGELVDTGTPVTTTTTTTVTETAAASAAVSTITTVEPTQQQAARLESAEKEVKDNG